MDALRFTNKHVVTSSFFGHQNLVHTYMYALHAITTYIHFLHYIIKAHLFSTQHIIYI